MSCTDSKIKLGEVVKTQKGYAFKSKWYTDEGTKIVKVSDFTFDSIDENNLVCIPKEIADDYHKYKLHVNDVIVQTVGSWPSNPASVVGKVIRVPDKVEGALLNQNAVKLIPDERVDKKYLFYLLKSPDFKGYIINTAQGAASQASITLDSIRHFKFDLPDIETQQKIASILSAFDDLIENNSRRIAILEEMARLIYREWFVHYRYPGHEIVELVDSGTELGEVPEGWEVAPFDDYLDVLSGGTPKTKIEEYWNGNIPFFTPKDATHLPFVLEAEKSITHDGLQKCSSKLYEPYTVFITARGTVGKLNMPIYPMAMNQSCYALRAKEGSGLSQLFTYYALYDKVETLQKRAHGAVFDTIIMDTFKQLIGVFPSKEIIQDFDNLVRPILKKIETLMVKNKRLKETRDLLLPKLISGKIEHE